MSDNRERSEEGRQGDLRPNVKPQHDQNQHGTQEKPEKTKYKPPRRSRSTDSERRGRRREREREHKERKKRGRSEEGRNRHNGDKDQSGYPEDSLDDTECPVCFCSYDNIFKTPKILACGHTFCLECLARINVSSAEIKTLSCPVCRELTEIRHGRDLPQLGNNEYIFRKLPPQMQKAWSVRFERSKGKLVLKNPPPGGNSSKKSITLPGFNKRPREEQPGPDVPARAVEEGLAVVTVINVGRPPNRMNGRFRRVCHSNQCYYAVVASIVVVTVALLIIGILTFVVVPNLSVHEPPPTQQGLDVHINHNDG